MSLYSIDFLVLCNSHSISPNDFLEAYKVISQTYMLCIYNGLFFVIEIKYYFVLPLQKN